MSDGRPIRWQAVEWPFDDVPTVHEFRGDRDGYLGRYEDYCELRGWGHSVEQAAVRLGVSVRHAWRYEAQMKREASAS